MKIVTARGIGEQKDLNMLSSLSSLNGAYLVDINWSASYGPVNPRQDPFGQSFKAALDDGMKKLKTEFDKGPALLAGYSGGAALAGNFAALGHKNIIAVGLVADPFDPGRSSGKYGIAGKRAVKNKPVFRLANEDDIIPRCPANSPLRAFSDVSAAFSLADPNAWGYDVFTKLLLSRNQTLNPIRFIQDEIRYRTAFTGVCKYLGVDPVTLKPSRNAHTDYDLSGLKAFFRQFI